MNEKMITFQRIVSKEEEGLYLELPFSVPDQVESMEVSYEYETHGTIIDFGLMDEKGEFIGWSGSNRSHITISECRSSDGFAAVPVNQGQWSILLGAYKIGAQGAAVTYRVLYHFKHLRIFKGDTHLHSTGSDGNMTPEELAFAAEKEGLDFLFITDHNNFAHNDRLRSTDKVTMIPGVEWTHYKGHIGMLGRKRPFKSFLSNSLADTREIVASAKEKGAFIVINHPFCPNCGLKWNMDQIAFDAVEVWNGSLLTEHNLVCLDWWNSKLMEGKRIPMTGGSDFHRYEPGRMPASPCTCVYTVSNSAADILEALKRGHSFLTLWPEGPMMDADASGKLIGDVIPPDREIRFSFRNLKKGDTLCLVSQDGEEKIICETEDLSIHKLPGKEGYLRVEIRRSLLPGLPQIPVLLSNPYYIAQESDAKI